MIIQNSPTYTYNFWPMIGRFFRLDSDEILVFKDGEVVERGTYEHLTQAKGFLYLLERGLDF